jgi:hypothetical protein
MTRWAIRRATSGKRAGTHLVKRWQFVAFAGPSGGESTGIVDLLAIRRDHQSHGPTLRRGDLFEIILIQIKGGSAAWPSVSDQRRLLAVKASYKAKSVVLATWHKGAEPSVHVLQQESPDRAIAWQEASPPEVFGSG